LITECSQVAVLCRNLYLNSAEFQVRWAEQHQHGAAPAREDFSRQIKLLDSLHNSASLYF